jgi:phosphohistidine phosphatase
LMRHAAAVAEGPGLIDEHRYLSEKGRQTARRVGAALATQALAIEAIHTSPLVRAVQTAELVAQATLFAGEVSVLFGLAPGFPPEVLAERISVLEHVVLLIGHEPGISTLGACLLGRPSFPPFRPGQISLIDNGLPQWTLEPETLAFNRLLVA